MKANKTLCIIGAGGHGRVIADIALACGKYGHVLFLDDADVPRRTGMTVVGKVAQWREYLDRADVEFFVAIGNGAVRERLVRELMAADASLATLVHPAATVGSNVSIGRGSAVMAGAVINCDTRIGVGAIVNTCASVDHDCTVGDWSHVSVGAHLCGTVYIGQQVWIGAGATVINNVSICDGAYLGAGAVVVKDIDVPGTYVGVPAKRLK